MFKIGNVKIYGKVVCGPMSGVTNKPFRKLVSSNGAALTYTEMTSNVGLKHNSQKTLQYADIDQNESPVALQIFGGSIKDYVDAAKYYDQNSNADIIDINMGCPVPKVALKSNAGSALLKTPEKIREIITKIVSEIKKPLTIKIRIGWDESDLTYLEVAKIAEKAGAAAIAVHGRTRKQMYSGKANWEAIKQIKQAVSIPVIGNGDVFTPEDAKRMLEETKVDAVMISRKAQKYPWIFKQVNDYLKTGFYNHNPISLEKMKKEIIKFYHSLVILKGEIVAFKELKATIINWLSNFRNLKKAKSKLVQIKAKNDFFQALKNLKHNN